MENGLVSNIENFIIIYSLEHVLPGNVFLFWISLIVFLYDVVKYGVINCQVGHICMKMIMMHSAVYMYHHMHYSANDWKICVQGNQNK